MKILSMGRMFGGFLSLVLTLGVLTLGQTNPVPLINQPLVPDDVAPGGNGFTLTVNGAGFVSGSVVNWNDSALATTFVTALDRCKWQPQNPV
jgi:hypothetical protein